MSALIQKRKQHYPVSSFLLQYLQHFGRRSEIPLIYDDLLRFSEAIPYENPSGEETLWLTVSFPPEVMEGLRLKLTEIYAVLKIGSENFFPFNRVTKRPLNTAINPLVLMLVLPLPAW